MKIFARLATALWVSVFVVAGAKYALAQYTGSGVTQSQLNAVAAAIPAASTNPIPPDTLNGTVGTSPTYVPGDAASSTVIQAANATTDASGNWTLTWAKAFPNTSYIVHAKAVVPSGNQPITCEVAARSSTTVVSGWCRQAAPVTVSILGATVNIFSGIPTTGTTVMVNARGNTQ